MTAKTIALFVIGIAGYAAWAVMAWSDPSLRPAFLTLNEGMVTGAVALALRDMPPPGPKP